MTALAAWRARMGYSQREAANALGVTARTYWSMENGINPDTKKPSHANKRTLLACAALEAGLNPISPTNEEEESDV